MSDGLGLLLLGLSMMMLIVVGLFRSFPLPEETSVPTLLFGTQGVIPAIVSFGTLVGAAITVRLLFRRARHDQEQLEHTRQTARIALFKDAVILLGQNDIAASNGINILGDLARTFPREFLGHSVNGLAAFLSEKTHAAWQAHVDASQQPGDGDPVGGRTTLSVLNAFGTIGALKPAARAPWPTFVGDGSGRFDFGWCYLERGNLRSGDYSYCDLKSVFCNGVLFLNCDFSYASFQLFAVGDVRFYGCTFSDTVMELKDKAGRKVGNPEFSATVRFENCAVEAPSRVGDEPILPNLIVGRVPADPVV